MFSLKQIQFLVEVLGGGGTEAPPLDSLLPSCVQDPAGRSWGMPITPYDRDWPAPSRPAGFGLLRKDVCAFMPFVNDHSPSVFLVKDWLVHHMNDILVFLVNDWLVDLVDYLLQIDRLVMLMYDLLMNLVH